MWWDEHTSKTSQTLKLFKFGFLLVYSSYGVLLIMSFSGN